MGNKGAFIVLNGKDMKPNFTTYEAVVSNTNILIIYKNNLPGFIFFLLDSVNDE